jgi:hypothetical protein
VSDGFVARLLSGVGRAVHRLVHPQYHDEQERIDRLVRGIDGRQSEQGSLLRKQLDGLSDQVSRLALDRDIRGLHRDLSELRAASGRQHKMLSQGLRYAQWQEELRVDERRVRRRIERLAKSTRPVLVGPWTGEVGFELLYWVPFVTWALREAGVAPERIVVVSRGGPSTWYAHLGGRYIDVLSHVSADEYRARTATEKKQHAVRAFDRELIRRITNEAQLERPALLHPGLMYRLFAPFWEQRATVQRIDDFTRYEKVAPPAAASLAGRLPADYVAVRFYFSSSFPDTAENRAFATATVRALSENTDVVMLGTGIRVDDHQEFTPARSARIHTIDDLMRPDTNLDIQTAVVAGARAFVGTYGGYAYLAPLCGVPALGFYSVRDAFHLYHLEVAERAFRRIGTASLVALDVANASLVRMALAAEAVHG